MVQAALPEPTVPIPRLAEHFRAAAEAMENAGCYELAFTTVVAICRLTAHGDAVTATLATLHLGRIARRMNDFRRHKTATTGSSPVPRASETPHWRRAVTSAERY